MLSLRSIRDARHVEHYFRMDDLTVEGRLTSSWIGQWASAFRLEPPVEPAIFRELLLGHLPGGIRLGCPRGGRLVHSPGFDATFSAPKSVSVAALVWGDRRLVDAHDAAVRSTLAWVESEHCCFRSSKGGARHSVPGTGLLAATFRHGLSRLADPQLHSHAVIFNFTSTAEGRFRSLHGLPVFNAAKLIGAYYRLELASAIQALGYGLRKTRAGFELTDVPEVLLRLWSKRSRDIEAVLASQASSRALASGRQKQYVTLLTRPPKTPVRWPSLSRRWILEQEKACRMPIRALPWRPARGRVASLREPDPVLIAPHIERALEDLDHHYGRFRGIEVYARVFEQALGEMDAGRLWQALVPALESLTVPVPAPGWTPETLGAGWFVKKTRADVHVPGPRTPPVYLAWGSKRAACLDLGALAGGNSSQTPDPHRLDAPFCLIEAECPERETPETCRFLLFYLPVGAPLRLLDEALTRAGALGLALALLEVPRREFGLFRTPGKHRLEERGLAPVWLRFEHRDAFLREHQWRSFHAHERVLAEDRLRLRRARAVSKESGLGQP